MARRTAEDAAPKSKVCRDAEVGDSSGHARCGGGLVTGNQTCQCSCHKRRGRPALQGGRREAARKRADRTRAALLPGSADA
jgi:hypothetical protein